MTRARAASEALMERNVRKADVVIAGGGASGLAAAIELGMAAPALDVLVIEKNEDAGLKIRATGSGRCNITNTSAEGYLDIMKFFTRIGLVTRAYENGLVYPYSESAADVADLLKARAEELGVRFAFKEELMSVRHLPAELSADAGSGSGNVFLLESVYKDRDGLQKVTTAASYLILAMGGKAGPSFGTIGDGYRIARNLGHRVVTPVPVITSVECEEWAETQRPCAAMMAGTRSRGVVRLYKRDGGSPDQAQELFCEEGEIQFTRYGLSGICVFNMTRHMRYDRAAGESLSQFLITADLYPDGDIEEFLRQRRDMAFPGEMASDVLRTVLKENIAAYVMRSVSARSAISADRPVGELSDGEIEEIGRAVHQLTFRPAGIRGWKDAQATSGGVAMDEIDEKTAESQLVSGLYITGELADRDFPCGGFNLSNAWITGIAAADDIAERSKGSEL